MQTDYCRLRDRLSPRARARVTVGANSCNPSARASAGTQARLIACPCFCSTNILPGRKIVVPSGPLVWLGPANFALTRHLRGTDCGVTTAKPACLVHVGFARGSRLPGSLRKPVSSEGTCTAFGNFAEGGSLSHPTSPLGFQGGRVALLALDDCNFESHCLRLTASKMAARVPLLIPGPQCIS